MIERPIAKLPRVVGIGGVGRPSSYTERSLQAALGAAQRAGCEIEEFSGDFLHMLPHYRAGQPERTEEQSRLLQAVRSADGLIIATPAYHGGISALVKNALDLLEDLREDSRPYLSGRCVGCIVTAHGWQAGGVVLTSLRSIVHALRGWPTPLGVTLNSQASAEGGHPNLDILGCEVASFASVTFPTISD